VVPPEIVVNHPYNRVMFDCETYALDNKSVAYTRRQNRTLGRRKKEVAQSFGVNDEWDGSPPAKVFQFLRKFAKACDDNCWDSKIVPLSYSHNTGVNGHEEFKLLVQQQQHLRRRGLLHPSRIHEEASQVRGDDKYANSPGG